MGSVSPELASIMARIKAQVETPEYQERVARERLAALEDERRAHKADHARRIERLSRLHVGFVRQHCDGDLMPTGMIPVVWAKLIAEWDWSASAILVGPTETQKTTAATWAAMWTACDGETVAHTTALRIATATDDALEEWRQAGLLILDELHRLDDQPAWKIAPVWDLVDCRYQSMGTTIVCATVDPDAMNNLAGAEVLRRIPLKITSSGAKEDSQRRKKP